MVHKGFFMSFQMAIFSFIGIELIGITAGETKDPHKTIPQAINNVPFRILLFLYRIVGSYHVCCTMATIESC